MARMTIRAARVNTGMAQKTAAAQIGVSNKTLSNWENGRSFPNVQQIEKLCALYSVAYCDLIFYPNNPLLAD